MIRTRLLFRLIFSIFFALIGAIFFAMLPAPASAHELSVEGTVGATLHIDPNDEPIAGSLATFNLEFKNTKRTFDPSEYNFLLTISQNGTEVATTSLFANGGVGNSTSFPYTFKEPGDYAISVIATPIDGDEHSTFSFDTHVTPAVTPQKAGIFAFLGVHGGHVLVTGLLIAILVIVVAYEKWKEYRLKRTGTNSISS